MGKNMNFCFIKAAAVDDAGVIQLVRDNVVLGPKNRGYGTCIGRETGLENHASFNLLELRDPLFELHVQAHGAGNRADRARAYAKVACSIESRLDQLGVCCEPEIIVRREIDNFLSVELR